MQDARNHEATCPEDVLALIPWYPEGALSADERRRVDAHAVGCAACREEIHALLGPMDAPEAVEAPPATRVLARVLDRIERDEAAGRRRGPRPAAAPARPSTVERRSGRLGRRLALAAMLVAAVGVGALAARTLGGPPVYHTAAAAAQATVAGGPILEMIPRDEASVAELRAALQRVEGMMVGGPEGMLGRYRVRLPAGADAAAAAALLRAEEGGIATYAEAVQL